MTPSITTVLNPTELDKLLKNNRLVSYILSSLPKTYVCVENSTIHFFLASPKSIFHLDLTLDIPVIKPMYMVLDMNKFLSSAKKVARGSPLQLILTESPATLRFHSSASNDKITLSVQYLEETSPELRIREFLTEKEPIFLNQPMIKATVDLKNFIKIANTFMTPTNKNNSIAIASDKLVYSDRTIVLSMNTETLSAQLPNAITLHKFILGFLDLLDTVETDTSITLSSDASSILWKGSQEPSWWACLAIDPCVIAIPEEADVLGLIPEDSRVVTVDVKPSELTTAIDFFSGLFEASSWKPVTFSWSKDVQGKDGLKLFYQHPSTEAEKELIYNTIVSNLTGTKATFTLISDAVRAAISFMADTGILQLSFNDLTEDDDHGQGVSLKYYDNLAVLKYSIVFAKLSGV